MHPRALALLWGCSGLAAGCGHPAALPPKAVALNRAGVQALEQGDLETADARLGLALEYNPKFVEALVNRGLLELRRGNFERASVLLGRARRLNPDVAQPHHALGTLAEQRGRPDQAVEHYRAALEVDPGFAAARVNLARVLFEAGQLDEALIQFRRSMEVAPAEPLAHEGLAECLLQLGRPSEAALAVHHARRQFPARLELVLLEARLELRRGNLDGARAALRPLAARRDPLGVAALGWLSALELVATGPGAALGYARRALELEPNDSLATYVTAQALEQLRDPGAPAWRARARLLSVRRKVPPR